MKLMKLLVSLACCLLFSTPLWAASIPPIEKATPNPSGLYALSHIAASGAVTELTDKELARIEGGDICTTFCGPTGAFGGTVTAIIMSGTATTNILFNAITTAIAPKLPPDVPRPVPIPIDIDVVIGFHQ